MDNQIIQWNIRGFRRNYDFLQILIQDYLPMAIALQETRLSMAMSRKHTGDKDFLRGYIPYLNNPQPNDVNEDSTQHGVGIFIHNKYISSPIDVDIDVESCQVIAVQITLNDSTITLCSLYRKSSFPFSKDDLKKIISKLPKPYMILGDFNAHSPIWGNDPIQTCGPGK